MPKNKEVARKSSRKRIAALNETTRSINAAYIKLHAKTCPECGARVLLPCRRCGVEQAKRAGVASQADNEPDDTCEFLPTPAELAAAMARERAKHMAYKLRQPYKPPELRAGNPKELAPVWETDDENDNCA